MRVDFTILYYLYHRIKVDFNKLRKYPPIWSSIHWVEEYRILFSILISISLRTMCYNIVYDLP